MKKGLFLLALVMFVAISLANIYNYNLAGDETPGIMPPKSDQITLDETPGIAPSMSLLTIDERPGIGPAKNSTLNGDETPGI